MPDDWIFNTLQQELERAQESHHAAKEKFVAKMREIGLPRYTSGIPMSDGSQMFRRALTEERHAGGAHHQALLRINAYPINGTVPEDLKKKLKSVAQTEFLQ